MTGQALEGQALNSQPQIEQTSFDVSRVRQDFPILTETVRGKPLIYLDNAATSQKPEQVIAAESNYYRHTNSNVHRAAHLLADQATIAFEDARDRVRKFLNAPAKEQIIWTKGTTEGINLVAQSWGRQTLGAGDVILVSRMEHHANIVPWQIVAGQTGAEVVPIDVTPAGEIDLDDFRSKLDGRVKMLAINHVSNSLGTINPVKAMTAEAHAVGALVLVDGAQAAPHLAIDVQDLDCDFYVISAHKVFGPTGIGALYGKRKLLECMPPWQSGGEMIERVSFEGTTFNVLPYKFEAGTPAIAQAIGFGAALDYFQSIDRAGAEAHERALLAEATSRAQDFKGLTIVGTAADKVSVLSFNLEGIHSNDVGTLLDQQGIAIRSGHHCCQPLMTHFGISGTARASFAFYNTFEELDSLFSGLHKVVRLYG